MSILSCAHVHTTYCDGKTPAADMAKRAFDLGFLSLGFSSHAPQTFDPGYCIDPAREADYKAEIRANLEKATDGRAENAFENEVIETICENAETDIPAAMIEDQLDSTMREMEMQMASQGIRMDDYMKYTGQTREQLRDMYRQQATDQVKTRLVVDAIRKAENITATDEEIDAEMQQYADRRKQSLEDFKASLTDADKTGFADAAATRKTFEFLKANAE